MVHDSLDPRPRTRRQPLSHTACPSQGPVGRRPPACHPPSPAAHRLRQDPLLPPRPGDDGAWGAASRPRGPCLRPCSQQEPAAPVTKTRAGRAHSGRSATPNVSATPLPTSPPQLPKPGASWDPATSSPAPRWPDNSDLGPFSGGPPPRVPSSQVQDGSCRFPVDRTSLTGQRHTGRLAGLCSRRGQSSGLLSGESGNLDFPTGYLLICTRSHKGKQPPFKKHRVVKQDHVCRLPLA